MTRLFRIFALLTTVFFVSCKEFPNPFGSGEVLARVGDKTLYLSDVQSVAGAGVTPRDSVRLLESYVDLWVKTQLKVQRAEQLFSESQQDIEQMVEDYRNSLLTYKVDQYYVDRLLDTVFTADEISRYYAAHRADFVLNRPIVRARVVRVAAGTRLPAKLRELMSSRRDDDYQNFVDLCRKNGLALSEYNDWTDFGELLLQLPTRAERDYDYLIREPKVYELDDRGGTCLVYVYDSRRAGDYQPEESVRGVIRRVIFNQRKQEIIRRYEDSLYLQALREGQAEVNLGKAGRTTPPAGEDKDKN
ncbi:MAG: hypothetical protein IJC16_02205 [Rikenellaceae bacterium]|nr:hypothetical protein [Rikenellaceae bacterium]